MRRELANRDGQRKKFRAIFSRIGKKVNYKGYSEDTILLTHVIESETNIRMSDHVWFSYSKGFEAILMKEGDIIEFEARIKEYKKGYVNRSLKINQQKTDFKLSHPTKIALFKSGIK